MDEIILPQLDGTATATIERYYLQAGDPVTPGQPLALVLTERFEWEVPATVAGTIAEIVSAPGASVAVGAALVRVRNGAAPTEATPPATEQPAVQQPAPASDDARAERRRATPLARTIAARHSLDLAAITGSGHGGLILRDDVLALVEGRTRMTVVEPGISLGFSLEQPSARVAPAAARPAPTAPAAATRSVVSSTAYRGPLSDAPAAITAVEADLSAVLAYVAAHGSRLGRRGAVLTPTVCIAHAVVAALGEHRLLNSVWSDDGLIVRAAIDLGVGGRVIARAAERSLYGLARALATDATDALPSSFSLAELGGSRWSEVLIPPGQSACLSIGAIEQRPVVAERDGVELLVQRPLALLALAYDARGIAQPEADAFLITVKRRLEHFSPL